MENWREFLVEQSIKSQINSKSIAIRAMELAESASSYLGKLEKPLTYSIKESDEDAAPGERIMARARTNGQWYFGKINYHKVNFYKNPIEKEVNKFLNLVTEWLLQIEHSTGNQSTLQASTSISPEQRKSLTTALLDIPAVIACSTIIHEIRHSYDYERYAKVVQSIGKDDSWLEQALSEGESKEHSILAAALLKGTKGQPLPPMLDKAGDTTKFNNIIEKYARKEEINFHPVMKEVAYEVVDKVSETLRKIIQSNLNMSLPQNSSQLKTLLKNFTISLFEEIMRDISETTSDFKKYEFAK